MKIRILPCLLAASALCASPALAQGAPPAQRHAYFGELHLHTYLSFDAWTFGTRVTPDQAFKFGRGDTVMVAATQMMEQGKKTSEDVPAKRAWPLDFMAVTDHSEYMGAMSRLGDQSSTFYKSAFGQELLKNPRQAFFSVARALHDKTLHPELVQAAEESHAWNIVMKAVQDNNQPGKFTTILAYEFTATAQPGGGNLHRNVFFNSDHAPRPFSSADSDRPEDLWTYMDSVRAKGIDCIAIPHNGNASNGTMYDWNTNDGKPINEDYAQRRINHEPLTEIVQTKGQSDTIPSLSPNDEFADFEIYDHLIANPTALSKGPGSYVRDAFGRGLVIEAKVGVNPYKYGVVGASDIHNGLSASDENAWAGGAWGLDPHTMLPTGEAAKRTLGELPPEVLDVNSPQGKRAAATAKSDRPVRGTPLENSGAGITGVWADANNRDSIFQALKRKETFATSGTRIRLRMFGGWNFDSKLTASSDWVATAYASGVPMGSDLPAKPAGSAAPKLAVWAVKSPDGANLDRVQIIKLWLDGGAYKEKIFDVALSDGRKDDPKTGKAPKVGNTVDLKTGKYSNSIGSTELSTVWQDPEFDAKKAAVYYVRVLEIPTPRWSTLLAVKNNLPVPKGVDATIAERGWSSPIWYTPTKS